MAREGSVEGIAFSEFNHHVAGVLVMLMGLAELAQAGRLPPIGWVKVLLPVSRLFTGHFRLIWSDHEAWPIGSLSVVQTYFGSDLQILQHKAFGVLLLAWASWNFYAGSGGLATSCGPSRCRSSRPLRE